jgi:predicted metallopeptidase
MMAKQWSTRKSSRRFLLKVAGATGVAGFLSTSFVERLLGDEAYAATDAACQGEYYHGFQLLPEGSPLPAKMVPATSGVPVMCGVNGQKTTALSRHFETQSLFKKALGMMPFYVPAYVPAGTQLKSAFVIEHEWGNLFAASLQFHVQAGIGSVTQAIATLWAEPDIPRPYPFFYGAAHDPYAVVPKKVNFLPSPGLAVSNQQIQQSVFYWIKQKTFYRLTVHGVAFDEAQKIASSLNVL